MMVGAALLFNVPSRAEADNKRSFTIKDSIEISYIISVARRTDISLQTEHPIGIPVKSADGKYFLLVTQRGVLPNNTLEGTIWLFNRQAIWDYASGRNTTKPLPRKLVTMAATSNTPVIYDVRWVDGSKKVAFLGKNGTPYQRLFVVDIETGSTEAVTKKDLYVTAYDMSGDTIVYTVLSQGLGFHFDTDLVVVGDRFLPDLIYREPPAIEDISESLLQRYSNSLHVQKAGKEIPSHFTMQGEPLQLFIPTLSLSPDTKFLITVAPVHETPKQWEQYQPLYEEWRLKPGPVKNMLGSVLNNTRPEQYIAVNLETGVVSPLIDAPAGRDLGYTLAPTEAFWLKDNRHVIVTNTYLPLSASLDAEAGVLRSQHAAVTLLDFSTGEIQASIGLKDQVKTSPLINLNNTTWDASKQELRLYYLSGGEDGYDPAPPEKYVLRAGNWVKTDEAGVESDDIEVSVRQDLNNPPMLWAQFRGRKAESPIWDPNPQFSNLRMGKATIYHWRDTKGRPQSGILALPPDFDRTHLYPLVIQTHGYKKDQYFATGGGFDTGTGGRALGARRIVVLQMNEAAFSNPPDEGPENLAAFESAIDHLVASGVVDRSRVGIVGFSRTTFHVRYSLVHHPDLFRAASITDGMDNSYGQYFLFFTPTHIDTNVEAINGGAPYGDGLTKWVRNANDFNLDKIRTPLLISGFQRGGLWNDWETYAGLGRLNKPVEYLWWWKGNTPHILVQPKQRYASQETAVDWFDFWLNGHEDSDPTKAEQYGRWRGLRKLQEENEKKSVAPGN